MMEKLRSSFYRNRKGIILMCISSLCVCFGQLLWKLSAEFGFFFVILGFLLYGAGALSMLLSYRYGKLSVLQPILSLNYVIAIVLSVTILNETISLLKAIGIICVILGVIFIAGGDKDASA